MNLLIKKYIMHEQLSQLKLNIIFEITLIPPPQKAIIEPGAKKIDIISIL